MPIHPDEEIGQALSGNSAAYTALQIGGSAWSRWTDYGNRAVDYVRECCRVLQEAKMLPDTGCRVCSVGCNDGLELDEFRRQGYEAEGFDLDPEKVRVAIACGNKAKVGDMHDPPFSEGVYNCVFASHVLEHARDHAKACAALGALLKPGGILFVVVPIESEFPAQNPSHTGFVVSPNAILCHFNGWNFLEPRVISNPEPQAVLVVRKPEGAV
jgi:SAM-dependent methyltransferase